MCRHPKSTEECSGQLGAPAYSSATITVTSVRFQSLLRYQARNSLNHSCGGCRLGTRACLSKNECEIIRECMDAVGRHRMRTHVEGNMHITVTIQVCFQSPDGPFTASHLASASMIKFLRSSSFYHLRPLHPTFANNLEHWRIVILRRRIWLTLDTHITTSMELCYISPSSESRSPVKEKFRPRPSLAPDPRG